MKTLSFYLAIGYLNISANHAKRRFTASVEQFEITELLQSSAITRFMLLLALGGLVLWMFYLVAVLLMYLNRSSAGAGASKKASTANLTLPHLWAKSGRGNGAVVKELDSPPTWYAAAGHSAGPEKPARSTDRKPNGRG